MTPKDLADKARRFLSRRRRAYQTVFLSPVGEEVIADLARFCRATGSTFHPDARVSAQLDGRREVFLRIQQHLRLTDDQLWQIMGRPDLD